MYDVKVTVEKRPKAFGHYRTIVREEFNRALVAAGQSVLKAVGRQFALQDAMASGKSAAAIELGRLKFVGDRVSIEVAPRADRAKVIEYIVYGRQAGAKMPPLEPIMEWLQDRKIVSAGDDPKKVRALAWYISKQISIYGIEPRPIFTNAGKMAAPRIRQIFEAAARRVAKRLEGTDGTVNNGQRSQSQNQNVA
jgi:hypothetical protein